MPPETTLLITSTVNNDLTLALVVIVALAFDFTNGFHDTGNAMATSIATGALPPRIAVLLSGALNLVGAFLSFSVAATIASGLVSTGAINLTVVLAGLCGGITWNLLTWYFGIPSSSSHALIGGVVGATIAAAGSHAVKWHGLVSKVIIPGVLSPFIALGIAAIGTWWVYRLTKGVANGTRTHGFRLGQIGSASMVSLAHGTNDAQKTMGVITLALVSEGALHSGAKAPDWVIVSCALAISLGTWIGGWRVIRTMGKGLTEIESPQGMAAEASSASAILLSSHFGYSLSTTQVATGSILRFGGWPADRSSLERGGSHGLSLDRDHAVGGRGGGPDLRHRQRHRRERRRHGGLPRRHRYRCHLLLAVPQDQGHARQRQRRVDRAGRHTGRTGGGSRMKAVLAISDTWINLNALWKICVIGLIGGAGLPVIFAVGLRLLSLPAGGAGGSGSHRGRRPDLFRQRRRRHSCRGLLCDRAGRHRSGYLLDCQQLGKDRPWPYPPACRECSTGCTPATRAGSPPRTTTPCLHSWPATSNQTRSAKSSARLKPNLELTTKRPSPTCERPYRK